MTRFITLRAEEIRILEPSGGFDTLHCGGAHTMTIPLGDNISHIQDLFNADEDVAGPVRVSLTNGAEFVVFADDVHLLQEALAPGNVLKATPVKATPVKATSKDTNRAKVLAYFERHDTRENPPTLLEIGKETGVLPATVFSSCKALMHKGLLRKAGRGHYYSPKHSTKTKKVVEQVGLAPTVQPIDWSGRIFVKGSTQNDQLLAVVGAVAKATGNMQVTISLNEVNRLIGDAWNPKRVRHAAYHLKYRNAFRSVSSERRNGDLVLNIHAKDGHLPRLTSNQVAFGELLSAT